MSPIRSAVDARPTPPVRLNRDTRTAYHGLSPHERHCFQRLIQHAHGQPAAGVFFRPFAAIAEQLQITPEVLRRIAFRPGLFRGSDAGGLPPFVHPVDGEPQTRLEPPPEGPCWYVPIALAEAHAARRDAGQRPRLVQSNPKAPTYDARA
ncbi:MAG: hypothetical protein EON55_09255 [Alphaproteobacteria bacterium]|nr:MAG: hypothetical protein EON55_09255 [Alphaproteobacteria bacterium]